MKKPDIILKLEKQLNVEFKEEVYSIFGMYDLDKEKAGYSIDAKGNIEMLNISNLKLEDISFLKRLKNIDYLYLDDNEISDISSIKELKSLRELSLSGNKVSDFSILKKLTNLNILELEENQMSDISFLNGLEKLEELYLSENALSNISILKKLTNLRVLELDDNKISDISSLSELSNLTELRLSGNQISDISALRKLEKIEILELEENHISDISALNGLSELKELNLDTNRIDELPEEIANLKNLNIEISGNPICISTEFEILNFKSLSSLKLSNLSKSINIIVGVNGTGKTSILQALSFSFIDDGNLDVDTRTLKRYVKKGEKEAFLKVKLPFNSIKELKISHKLESNGSFDIMEENLLLAYGANLFHKTEVIDRTLLDELINGTALNYSTFSIFEDFTDEFTDPAVILHELNKQRDPKFKAVFFKLFNTINEFLAIQGSEQFQIVDDWNSFYYQNTKTKENFKLFELSEGYRSNILLISDILIRILSARSLFSESISDVFDKVTGTILIDEFDKHLHPKWQRLFVQKLKETLPNIQFFLTTHNPLSLQSGVGGTAIILESAKKVSVANIEPNSIEVILNKYFDFNSDFFDVETEEIFKEFYERIDFLTKKKADLKKDKKFKEIVDKLSERGEEVINVVGRELRRLQWKSESRKGNEKV